MTIARFVFGSNDAVCIEEADWGEGDIPSILDSLFDRLPMVGNRSALVMETPSGGALVEFDLNGERGQWLMRHLLRFELLSDDESGDVDQLRADSGNHHNEQNILPGRHLARPRSVLSRLMLMWLAIIFWKPTRFSELRRLVWFLRYVDVVGWGEDLNLAYLDSARGWRRVQRAIAIATVQFAAQKGLYVVIVGFAIFLYSVWGAFNV